jgi:hypothetical protein
VCHSGIGGNLIGRASGSIFQFSHVSRVRKEKVVGTPYVLVVPNFKMPVNAAVNVIHFILFHFIV